MERRHCNILHFVFFVTRIDSEDEMNEMNEMNAMRLKMNEMRLKMKDTFERLCSLCSLHVYFPTHFGAQTLLDPLSTALHFLQLVGKIRFSSWSNHGPLFFSASNSGLSQGTTHRPHRPSTSRNSVEPPQR